MISKNTLKEITPNNINIKMSKNNNKNKNIKYNIDYSNMSKTVKLNVDFLNTLANKIKNETRKEKAKNIIQLYADRKISQKTTAEKQINNFINYDIYNKRKQTSVDKQYVKLVDKYTDVKPLGERMKDNKFIERIEINDEDRAKTEVIFHI